MDGIGQWFHDLLQSVIDGLGDTLGSILDILPDSPFTAIDNSPISEYIGYINWIVPMTEIIAILQVWVVAIATYYLVVIVLRWIKAIQ